jgi:ligand-binding SRPBCC domain-containing protein
MRDVLHCEQWVPYPLELVFRFFANPRNLPPLMPGWQDARIDRIRLNPPPRPESADPNSIAAGDGSVVVISMRPLPMSPLRIPWEARIEDFVWNEQFCDVQVRGPFRYWKHCHRVTAESRVPPAVRGSAPPVEGTLIRDTVEYEAPFGWLGQVAQTMGIRRALEMTFSYRHRRTPELLAKMAAEE